MSGIRGIAVVWLLGLPVLLLGCGAGKEFDAGRKAEAEGSPNEAYDNYYRAAKKHPGNFAVVDGLKRTGPAAAEFWEGEALAAADDGRYADSWRMWMRALEIRPDHPTAPRMIHQLEQQHPEAIAKAKTEYIRGGPSTLAAAKPTGKGAAIVAAGGTTQLASADGASPRPAANGPVTPVDRGATAEAVASAVNPANRGGGAELPGADASSDKSAAPSKGERLAKASPSRFGAATNARPPEPGASRSEPTRPIIAPSGPERETRGAVNSGTDRQPAKSSADSSRRSEATGQTQKPVEPRVAPSGLASDYMTVLILSKKDRRYPKETDLGDGIRVKLCDTGDKPDVDMDLNAGKTRIKKIRGLQVGRSCIYRGQSGAYYRLMVLDVYHKNHTARIGLRPA